MKDTALAEHRDYLNGPFQPAEEAEAIDEIMLRISSSLDLKRTLQTIVESAAALSDAPYASIWLSDDEGRFRALASHGVPMDSLQRVVLTAHDGLLQRIVETGEPAQTADFEKEVESTSEARTAVAATGVHATLGVPMLHGSEVVGALYLGETKSVPFSSETVRVLRRLATFAQVALENAQRFSVVEADRERSRSNLLAQLLEISAVLNSNLTVPTLLERVVEAAMTVVGATAGTVGLIEHDQIVFRRFHGPDGWINFDVTVNRGEGTPGYVWETGHPYISNDCQSDPRVISKIQERIGFRRLVIVPMADSDGRTVGTLSVYDPAVDRDFVQIDAEALQLLAHQAAIAIENARLNQLKDEFLSIVSHELKTPVTSMKGFAQVLKRRLSPSALEGSVRYLDVINHQADRLTALINDLLDLSRIQTGRFSFDREVMDYAQLVRETVAEMQLMNGQNEISQQGPDSALVRGSPERLRQVLVNLVDNAVKHGPQGGVVSVLVEVYSHQVITRVTDEGPGVPEGEDERIFLPYYQVRQGARHHAKGLGLGLYITRQIVNEHGGTIWLDVNGKTSFCFAVPASEKG